VEMFSKEVNIENLHFKSDIKIYVFVFCAANEKTKKSLNRINWFMSHSPHSCNV